MSISTPQTLQAKPDLTRPAEPVFLSHVLRPAGEFPEEAKGRKNEQKSNYRRNLRKALQTKPDRTKEIKTLLEQSLVEKLETWDINADTRSIPNDLLSIGMSPVESRHKETRQTAIRQQIRESLHHELNCKLKQRTFLPSDRQSGPRVDTHQAAEVLRASQLPPQNRQSVTQKPAFPEKTAVPKIQKNSIGHFPRRSASALKPVLGSQEELGEDGFMQAWASPESPLEQSSPSTKDGIRKITVSSGTDGTDGSKTVGPDVSPEPTGACMETLVEKVGKMVSHHRHGNKPARGINAADVLMTKEEIQDELKCLDVEDDDWDTQPLEEGTPTRRNLGKSWRTLHW